MQIPEKTKNNNSIIKQIYLYLVTAVSLLFVCSSIFGLVSSQFTTNNMYFMPYTDSYLSCSNDFIRPNPDTTIKKTKEEIDECVKRTDESNRKNEEITKKSGLVNNSIILALSGVVLFVHAFFVIKLNKDIKKSE